MAPKNRRKPTSSSYAGNRSPSGSIFEDSSAWETREGGNPYQFKGPKAGFESKAMKDGLYLRIDMPGVIDDGAEVWMEGKELFFSGEAHNLTEFEDKPNRGYGGCIDLTSDDSSGQISEIKSVMKNGVLRIVLVGCGIKPDRSDPKPLWRPGLPKPRPAPPTRMPLRQFAMFGNELFRYRSWSFLDPPDDSSTGLYPFQLSGSLESYERKQLSDNHLFMRVDVPDVPSEGMTVKVRDNQVFWSGKSFKGSSEDNDEEIRGYFGKIEQLGGCCNYVVLKSEVKYGVFRILLEMKKIKPASESADHATGNTELPLRFSEFSSGGCV